MKAKKVITKIFNWQTILGLSLLSLSAGTYYIHYLIFRDLHHIFIYLVGDIAFVFLEVLLVTLILHKLLSYREKKSMLKKMNMVIGAFFSEVGVKLLDIFSEFDVKFFELGSKLLVKVNWTDKDFNNALKNVKTFHCDINSRNGDLTELRRFLLKRRQFFLNLLQNANLLEHETFTNLLWSIFHLTEELEYRGDLEKLPDSDRDHLTGDMKRAYLRLIHEWISYMKHLKGAYPYLFSLSMRTNPFDKEKGVIVG